MSSIFTDFDHFFGGENYTAMHHVDGSTDIVHQGQILEHHAQPGMVDFQDGNVVMHNHNVFGGEDTYVNGHLDHSTHHNIFGGEDVYDNAHGPHLARSTMPNVHGGENIYDASGHLLGITYDNHMGGEDFHAYVDSGNASHILSYDDPLVHAPQYVMPTFNPLLK